MVLIKKADTKSCLLYVNLVTFAEAKMKLLKPCIPSAQQFREPFLRSIPWKENWWHETGAYQYGPPCEDHLQRQF